MSRFEKLVDECYKVIVEEAPPAPATGAAPAASAAPAPDVGGAPDAGGGAGGGAPPAGPEAGGAGGGAEDAENETKREADPREYTRSILSLLVDKKEGVTPEMFGDFMDSVSLAITKIKDKEGIKQFYGNFYKKLTAVLELREELKSMFNQLSGTIDDLVGAKSEPDAAGGGIGKAGPSGPGVNQ
jgi:hypothetical protein